MNNPPLILVVDDNETNRDILITRLEKHGYRVAAGSGRRRSAGEDCPA